MQPPDLLKNKECMQSQKKKRLSRPQAAYHTSSSDDLSSWRYASTLIGVRRALNTFLISRLANDARFERLLVWDVVGLGNSQMSISSSDRPFVSLTKNQVYSTSAQLKQQNMRKAFHRRLLTAAGVTWDSVKLNSHCVAAPTAMPPSRTLVGKISLIYSCNL